MNRRTGFAMPQGDRRYCNYGPAAGNNQYWGRQGQYRPGHGNGYNSYGARLPVAWQADYELGYYEEPPRSYPAQHGNVAYYGGPPPWPLQHGGYSGSHHACTAANTKHSDAAPKVENTGCEPSQADDHGETAAVAEDDDGGDKTNKKKRRRRRRKKKQGANYEGGETEESMEHTEGDKTTKHDQASQEETDMREMGKEEQSEEVPLQNKNALNDKVATKDDKESRDEQHVLAAGNSVATDVTDVGPKKKTKKKHSKRKMRWTVGNVLNSMLCRNGYAHHSNNFPIQAEPEDFTEKEKNAMAYKWHRELAFLELGKARDTHNVVKADSTDPVHLHLGELWDNQRQRQLRRDLQFFGGVSM